MLVSDAPAQRMVRPPPPAEKFSAFYDAQHRARFLVPKYPVHSRVDELDRVRDEQRRKEAHRADSQRLAELCDQERTNRLQHTLSLVRTRQGVQLANQRLRESCSNPALARPLGDYTPAVRLLNRRVDVNRRRAERAKRIGEVQKQVVDTLATLMAQREEVAHAIEDFERAAPWNNVTRDAVGETAADWTNTRRAQRTCTGRLPRLQVEALDETLASGWASQGSAWHTNAMLEDRSGFEIDPLLVATIKI